eukprot:11168434-Lingulodinium_polyedra.AAC.1
MSAGQTTRGREGSPGLPVREFAAINPILTQPVPVHLRPVDVGRPAARHRGAIAQARDDNLASVPPDEIVDWP